MSDGTCPLCKGPAAEDSDEAWFRYRCGHCGTFRVSEELRIGFHVVRHAHLLSGVTRNASERGTVLNLTTVNVEVLTDTAPAIEDVETKAKTLLRHLTHRSKTPGELVTVDPMIDCPLCFAAGENELFFLLTYIKQLGWINWESSIGPQRCDLTADGWIASRATAQAFSEKAFVAMWFHETMLPAWTDGLLPAIRLDSRFQPLRLDFEEHNDMIDDRIQAEIRESRFLVADLTGHRNGVYFEAGLALGLGLPVIWTCRKEEGNDTHLDTRQYNRIEWETPAELREKLALRIRATIGMGPLRDTDTNHQSQRREEDDERE